MSVRISQATIDYRLKLAYQKIDSEREPVCQGCGRGDKPLSHSHTISRKRCKDLGKPELIYDVNNIELECFGSSADCHYIWENTSVENRMKLNNFDRKLEYIRLHDPERYRTISLIINDIKRAR